MKKALIFILIATCVTQSILAGITFKPAYTDTTVIPQILSLQLNNYIGKPVDSLLMALASNYTFRGFMPYGIGYNRGVFQSYGDSEFNTVSVRVFIDHYQFMTFPNRSRPSTWDMNLAKKETIAYIKVIKNNKICVFGCNNPNYDD